MKKILTLAIVLFSTVMFAKGTGDNAPAAGSSGMAVIKNGESTFRVIYKSETETNVKVSILNDKNEVVFFEKLAKTDGFSRPYNFASLAEGDYTIAVEDGKTRQSEKISYRAGKPTRLFNVIKVNSDAGKYLVTAAGQGTDFITVTILDGAGKEVHRSQVRANGDYAQLFNLQSLEGHFTFELQDAAGESKSISF